MGGSEDPPAVDQGAPAPDCAASSADQPCLPGILVHLSELPTHNPGGSLGQPTVTVAPWRVGDHQFLKKIKIKISLPPLLPPLFDGGEGGEGGWGLLFLVHLMEHRPPLEFCLPFVLTEIPKSWLMLALTFPFLPHFLVRD